MKQLVKVKNLVVEVETECSNEKLCVVSRGRERDLTKLIMTAPAASRRWRLMNHLRGSSATCGGSATTG